MGLFNSSHLPDDNRIGVVAGWGHYPIELAEHLRSRGLSVYAAAIRNHASPQLEAICECTRWFGVAKLGGYQKWFHRHGITSIVFAGKIFKERILFHGMGWLREFPDLECIRAMIPHFITRTKTTGDDALLTAAVDSFERRGQRIVPGTALVPELLCRPGCWTRRKPNRQEWKDMRFGWQIAKAMGGLDIGQTVVIRDQSVLCVEAIEGTDACIARAADVCPRGGFVVVKVAKPHQDQRFDLPTVGLNTVRNIDRAGGKCLLVEADQTIIVERDAVVQFMNDHGMSLYAWRAQPSESTFIEDAMSDDCEA